MFCSLYVFVVAVSGSISLWIIVESRFKYSQFGMTRKELCHVLIVNTMP